VALEALIEFANRDTNRGLYTMSINMVATSTAGWSKDILLSKDYYGLHHSIAVSLCELFISQMIPKSVTYYGY